MSFNGTVFWLIISEIISVCVSIGIGVHTSNQENSVLTGTLVGIVSCALLQCLCFAPFYY